MFKNIIKIGAPASLIALPIVAVVSCSGSENFDFIDARKSNNLSTYKPLLNSIYGNEKLSEKSIDTDSSLDLSAITSNIEWEMKLSSTSTWTVVKESDFASLGSYYRYRYSFKPNFGYKWSDKTDSLKYSTWSDEKTVTSMIQTISLSDISLLVSHKVNLSVLIPGEVIKYDSLVPSTLQNKVIVKPDMFKAESNSSNWKKYPETSDGAKDWVSKNDMKYKIQVTYSAIDGYKFENNLKEIKGLESSEKVSLNSLNDALLTIAPIADIARSNKAEVDDFSSSEWQDSANTKFWYKVGSQNNMSLKIFVTPQKINNKILVVVSASDKAQGHSHVEFGIDYVMKANTNYIFTTKPNSLNYTISSGEVPLKN